jgi:hypothetical protein
MGGLTYETFENQGKNGPTLVFRSPRPLAATRSAASSAEERKLTSRQLQH